MYAKFESWEDETQDYIRQSLCHAINKYGFVINLHTNGIVEEDYIFDAIELGKVYPSVTRKQAIDTLSSIDNMNSNESYVVAHVIEYLKHNFIEGEVN